MDLIWQPQFLSFWVGRSVHTQINVTSEEGKNPWICLVFRHHAKWPCGLCLLICWGWIEIETGQASLKALSEVLMMVKRYQRKQRMEEGTLIHIGMIWRVSYREFANLHASGWVTGVFWVHLHDGDITVNPVVMCTVSWGFKWDSHPRLALHPPKSCGLVFVGCLDTALARLPCWTWWLKPCWCCLPPRFRWMLMVSFPATQ